MAGGITHAGPGGEPPELSIVVPVYGCVSCLQALTQRVGRALDGVVADWELIFVDDESPDGSWSILCELSKSDERIHAVRLSRNFGQHAAITAGLAETRGRRVAVMDCDLQDPPEELPRLLAAAGDGWDIVLSKRDRRRQAWHRRIGAYVYFRTRNRLLGLEVDPEYSTLSVLSRDVVDAYLQLGDRDRQYMLILHWLGYRWTVVTLQHAERYEGKSSYTVAKLVKVALDGMFFQTTVLLRWIIYLGFSVALAGLGLAVVLVVLYFVNRPLPGFTSLAVLILLVGGFIILSTGVTGLYVGKIFEQVKGRPLYLVAERAGARRDEDESAPHGLGAERGS